MAGRKYGIGKYGKGTYDLGTTTVTFPPWVPIDDPPSGNCLPIPDPPPAWTCPDTPPSGVEIWNPVYG